MALGGRIIWSQGTFRIPQGSMTAIIGPNGAGKTTLLRMLLGLIPVHSGSLRVLGREPGRGRSDIGYVPQDYTATSGEALRAIDAVQLGLSGPRWGFRRTTSAEHERAERALAEVDASEYAQRRIADLSGGERQRVAIAQALVFDPALLALDEPLANLDIRSQTEITTLLGRLRRQLGLTVLVVAHDLNPLLSELTGAIYLLDGHAHYDSIEGVVDPELLSHLYGTNVRVARTPQGDLFMRSVSEA